MPKTTAHRSAPKRSTARVRNGVLKTVLPNGLTVVLRENHNAPVATFWVWYRIGSGRERTGITGISHWVEHMLFKGTQKFPGRSADQVISREGGQWNGFTWLDFTTYFETLPAEKIELGVSLEADRMVNAPFRPRDVSSSAPSSSAKSRAAKIVRANCWAKKCRPRRFARTATVTKPSAICATCRR